MNICFSTKNLSNLYSLCVDVFEFETVLGDKCLKCTIGESVLIFKEGQLENTYGENVEPLVTISLDYEQLDYDQICNRLQLYCFRSKQLLSDLGINLCLDNKMIEWKISPHIILEIKIVQCFYEVENSTIL